MKNFKKLIMLVCFLYAPLSYAEVAVIVNSANQNTLSESDISRLFLGKMKSFDSGNSVLPINLKVGDPIRDEFEQKALGKSSQQIKAYWSKLVFSGKGKPPKEMDSVADIIAFVSSNPDAIAYIDSASVTDAVKVVKTF